MFVWEVDSTVNKSKGQQNLCVHCFCLWVNVFVWGCALRNNKCKNVDGDLRVKADASGMLMFLYKGVKVVG